MEAALKAIAEPHRRHILTLVRDGEMSAGAIAARFPISGPAISQHLKVLKEAGLVDERRDGTRRLYSLKPDGLAGSYVPSGGGRMTLELLLPGRLGQQALRVEVDGQLVAQREQLDADALARDAIASVPAMAAAVGDRAGRQNPWRADRHRRGLFGKMALEECLAKFKKSVDEGLLKVMSKMGIAVVSSYRGGLNFEAVGLSRTLVAEFFPGMPSRISGKASSDRRVAMRKSQARASSSPAPIT